MSFITVTSHINVLPTVVDLGGGANSHAYVATGFSALSGGLFGIFGTGDRQSATVDGTVAGPSVAILFTGNAAQVLVGQAGHVFTTSMDSAGAVMLYDDGGVENAGLIQGASGVELRAAAEGAIHQRVENFGTFSGRGTGSVEGTEGDWAAAIRITDTRDLLTGDHTVEIVNHGLIAGTRGRAYAGDQTVYAILAEQPYDGLDLANYGTIEGEVRGSRDSDLVVNTGTIHGDLRLYDGADSYHGGNTDTGMGRDSWIGRVFGGADNDRLFGGNNADVLLGESGSDLVQGGAGDDQLWGDGLREGGAADSDDTLRGQDGDDTLQGGEGNDDMSGGDDNDLLEGGSGIDTLTGGRGDDTLLGGAQGDYIYGGRGEDLLEGGAKKDKLDGGKGDDTLIGGSSRDTFIFDIKAGDDVITDFEDGTDLVDLSAYGMAGFGPLGAALSDSAAGAVIDLAALGGAGSVLVQGMVVADLTAADFVLYSRSGRSSRKRASSRPMVNEVRGAQT